MPHSAVDPLVALTARKQHAEPSAARENDRFSTALEAAVRPDPGRQPPANDRPEPAGDAATADQPDRNRNPDASSSFDDNDATHDTAEEVETLPADAPADGKPQPAEPLPPSGVLLPEVAAAPSAELLAPTTEPTDQAAEVGPIADATPLETQPTADADANRPPDPTLAVATPSDDAELAPEETARAATAPAESTNSGEPIAVGPHDGPRSHADDALVAPIAATPAETAAVATPPEATTAAGQAKPAEPRPARADADAPEGDASPLKPVAAPQEPARAALPAAVASEEGLPPDPATSGDGGDEGAAPIDTDRSGSSNDPGVRSWNRLTASRGVHPTAEADAASASTPVDRPRFLQRISGAIEAAERRGGRIEVRLSPPELGSLRIELVMKQGTLAATLETETAAARQVLLENLPALRLRLAEQDIRVEQFDVDVRRDGREAHQEGPGDRRPGDQPRENRARPAAAEPSVEPSATSPSDGSVAATEAENLDVRI